MNFDDLKDKLREIFATLWSGVQESSAWIELSEKFHNLSSVAQKGVIGGAAALFFLILFAIPWSFYSASQDAVTEFEDRRQLIRDLYRVSRATKTLPPLPGKPGDLPDMARGRLQSAHLQPDQIISVSPMDEASTNVPGVPKTLDRDGVVVTLKKLNLRQVIDIGQDLQVMHPSTKMTGMEINANREDGHFFDVVYKVLSITVPPEPIAKVNPNDKKARGKPSKPSKIQDEDGD